MTILVNTYAQHIISFFKVEFLNERIKVMTITK